MKKEGRSRKKRKANKILIKQEEDKKMKKASLQIQNEALNNNNNNNNENPNTVNKKKKKKEKEEQKEIIDFKPNKKLEASLRNLNKKLSVICTCFIPDYDLLMISSTNNTITAWKYTRNEIKNVNVTSEYRFSKDELKIAIFITNFPQTSMVWDSQQKCLLTGQRDGKILKWDLTNPNPILEDTLSISSVLEKVGKSHLNRRENQNSGETKRLLQQLREKSIRHKDSLTNPFILEDKNKNIAVSYLLVISIGTITPSTPS